MGIRLIMSLHRWQLLHRLHRPLEAQVCVMLIFLWVLGWASLPTLVVLDQGEALPLSLAACLAPQAYISLRRHLHRLGRLRCDWIGSLG